MKLRLLGDLQQSTRLLMEAPFVSGVKEAGKDGLEVSMHGGREAVADAVEKLTKEGMRPYQVVTQDKVLERMFLESTAEPADDR